MTPLPWCRVGLIQVRLPVLTLASFWVVHLAGKTLSHHYLESFLWGRNPNLNPTTHRNNIEYLDKPTKSLLPKTKKGEGNDLFKKKCLQQKPGEVYCSLLLRLVLNFLVFRLLRFSSSLTNPQTKPNWRLFELWFVYLWCQSLPYPFLSEVGCLWWGCGLTTHFGEKTYTFWGRFFPLKNHPTKDGFWGQVTPSKRLYPLRYPSRTPLAKKKGSNS